MTKTRFTPWIVLACIGTLAGCTSGEGGSTGNTELNVVVPSGGGSSAPAGIDIQVVEYTINCDATPPTATDLGVDSIEPTFDPDVTINGVLEVLDTASGPVDTQNFGPDLDEVYVWQGFMDIPLEAVCTVQLRARDADGEVICTDTVDFDTNSVAVGGTVKVNVLMYCGISFQAPVAMLDLDGDFSFNISNFCPDLFVLNCIDTDIDIRQTQVGEVAATACQVRARDGDSQCGDSCDPQSCVEDAEGLTCTPAPEPALGLKTTVSCGPPVFVCAIPNPALFGTPCNPTDTSPGSCNGLAPGACVPNAVIDCTGTNTPAPNCVFNGDVLGQIGAPAPGPLAAGEGGFFVACVLADDDGDPNTPPVPVTPGATVTCEAVTTDGDTDCDKVKTVDVVCPGLSPCQQYATDGFECNDGSECTIDSCNDAAAPAAGCGTADNGPCCETTPVPDSPAVACDDFDPQPGLCVGGVCESQGCSTDADCPGPDGNCLGQSVCTNFVCGTRPPVNDGGACANSGEGSGVGICNATGVCNSTDTCGTPGDPACPDTDECNLGFCDTNSGPWACGVDPNLADGEPCNGGTGVCSAGACVVPPYIEPAVEETGYRAGPRICLGTPNGSWPYIDSGDSPTGGAGTCALCLSNSCSGGTNAGNACNVPADCPGGNCVPTSPSNEQQCALDCFTYICGTANPTALFPGGGPSGACSYPSVSTNCPVRGCEVVSNTLKLQLGVDTLLFLQADSAGQSTRELTLSYEVQAYNNALGLAAALAAVNDVTVVSDLTNANPATITNKLDPALAGDDVSDFLVAGVFIIDPTQLLPQTEVVTPTGTPVLVGFDEAALLLELVIKSSGAPLDITGASCTFSNEAGTCLGGQNNLQACNPSLPNGGTGTADCSVTDIFGESGVCVNTGGTPISLPANLNP